MHHGEGSRGHDDRPGGLWGVRSGRQVAVTGHVWWAVGLGGTERRWQVGGPGEGEGSVTGTGTATSPVLDWGIAERLGGGTAGRQRGPAGAAEGAGEHGDGLEGLQRGMDAPPGWTEKRTAEKS